MQFFKPEYFFYLWIVPAVFVFYFLSQQFMKKRLARLVPDETLLVKMIEGYRKHEWRLRATLMTLAMLCFILALARPQWGDEKRSAQRKGSDIIFLVDTSLSMLAEDVKPNRIGKAKFEIEAFIRNLRGDRVGMVTFSGSGFLQTPLTLDHAAFLLFLDAVQVGFIPDPGTSLLQAIQLAIRAFPQKELKYKALILFSDGEDHEGSIEQAIEAAKKAEVRIYTIGLGTKEGDPIPLKNEKGERSGFKKTRGGQMVITRLNQPLLERLAKETGGIYLPATPGEKEVEVILKHLRSWGEQQFEEKVIVEKEDQYQGFLLLGFLFIILEMLIRRRDSKIAALMVLASFFLFTGFFETSQDTVKKGNTHFTNKRYQSAIEAYRKVQVKKPDAPEVLYDLGTALYKVDSFQESAENLNTVTAEKTLDPKLKAQALYNYGNAQYRLGNFEKAIDAYKKSLELDPKDADAKYNLEFLQKQKNQFDKKDQEKKKNDPKKDEQKKNQPKQSQQQQQQNQGQGEKDKQNQGQGQQDKQDQKQDQQQQPKPEDQKDQQQSQDQQQKDPEQKKKEEQDQQKQEEKQSEQEKEAQKKKEEQEAGKEEKQQGQEKKPLQGQMSMDNALNLLDALKESEKELQDLRRPPVNKNPPPVDKDW